MLTCLDIIGGAVIELGARDAAEALSGNLESWEATRSMDVLQSMYRAAVEAGSFGRVSEYVATANYEAKEQERVFAAGFTITLPDAVEDCDTGETRKPRDLAMIQVVDEGEDPQISIYDANAGSWVRIDNLDLNSEAPLASRNRQGFECALARRVAGTFKRPIPESTNGFAAGLSSALTNRYSAPRTETQAEYF